jgi:folate-binding protein YgfZ
MKQNSPLTQFFIENGFLSQGDSEDISFPTYTDEKSEISFVNSGAGIRDISAHPLFRLTGADVFDFIHRISTNDVKSLAPFEMKKTIFTNEKGRILDEVMLFVTDSGLFILGHEGKHELLEFWLNRYIIADDVHVENLYGKYGALEVIGPKGGELLQKYFGDEILHIQANRVYTSSIGNFLYKVISENYAAGLIKYTIVSPLDSLKVFIGDVIKTGHAEDIGLLGEKAYECYRITAGILSSAEINDNYNPHEAKLLDSVCFTKGCYIGQEVISRLSTYNKVQRYLCNLVFDKPLPNGNLPELFNAKGQMAGKITSQTFCPESNTTVAMGYVERNCFQPEQKLSAMVDGRTYEVTIKELGSLK